MQGKKPTTTQPGDFSKDRIERILAEARGEAQTVPVVSRAPKPSTPIRRPSSGMPPELIKQPRKLPTDYPDTLSLRTWDVINEAREKEKFPRRSQLLDFCKQVLANLTPDFYGEVQAARLKGPRAVSHLDGLLDSLLLCNEYSEPILDNLRQELKRSKEWAAFIRELSRAEQQARGSPQSSGKVEAQKLERLEVGEEIPASQRAPTSKKKRQFKGFEGLPKKPETETERLIDAARLTKRQHECALLHWVYQQDVAEIARRLELKSRKSVQVHLSAAKAKMDSDRAKLKRGHGVRTSPATPNL